MNPKPSLAKLFYVDLASVSDHFIPTSNVDSFHLASDLSWVEKIQQDLYNIPTFSYINGQTKSWLKAFSEGMKLQK